MQRFTLPRDLYHGKGALEALKTLEGKKAIVCVGGGSMKRFGFFSPYDMHFLFLLLFQSRIFFMVRVTPH